MAGERAGRATTRTVRGHTSRWAASRWRLPHGIVPGLIAYRKSWFDEVGATAVPEDATRSCARSPRSSRRRAKPYGQTLGHTFGDARRWAYPLHVELRRDGDRQERQDGRIDSKGTVEAVKFMTAFWKDSCDEGGLAWDDTNNNRAFLAGEICATLNGALDLHRGQARSGQDQGRARASRWCVTSSTRALPDGPGRRVELPGLLPPRGHEVREEPEAGQGLPEVAPRQGAVRQVVPGGGRLLDRLDQDVGAELRCGTRSTSR